MTKSILYITLLFIISCCFGYETNVIVKSSEKADCGSYNVTLISNDLFNITLYKYKNTSYHNVVQEFETIISFINVKYFYQDLLIEADDSYIYEINIQRLSNSSYIFLYKNIKACDEKEASKSKGRLLTWPGILVLACICTGSGGLCACCKKKER